MQMRRILVTVTGILWGGTCAGVEAPPGASTATLVRYGTTIADAPPLYWYRLKNGLNVLVLSDMRNPRTYFQIRLAAGSSREPAAKRGLAHLLEHMMFRKAAGREETIDTVVRAVGGSSNAWTSLFWVVYHAAFPAPALSQVLASERKLFVSFQVDKANFDTEREVVRSEYHLRLGDRAEARGFEQLSRYVEQGTPWEGTAVGGEPATIAAITPEDISDFHAKYYKPDNATISIGGPLPKEQLLAEVEAAFGSWQGTAGKESFPYSPDSLARFAGKTFVCGAPIRRRSYRILFRHQGFTYQDIQWNRAIQWLLNDHDEGDMERRLRRLKLAQELDSEVSWDGNRFFRLIWEVTLDKDQSIDKVLAFLKTRVKEVRDSRFPSWVRNSLYDNFKSSAANLSETMTTLLTHYDDRLADYGDPFILERAPDIFEAMESRGMQKWIDANLDFSRAQILGVVPESEAPPCSGDKWKEAK